MISAQIFMFMELIKCPSRLSFQNLRRLSVYLYNTCMDNAGWLSQAQAWASISLRYYSNNLWSTDRGTRKILFKKVENSTLGSAPPSKCGIFHTFNFFEGSPKLRVSLIIIDHRLNWRQWLYGYLYIVDYSIPEEDWGWKVAGIY